MTLTDQLWDTWAFLSRLAQARGREWAATGAIDVDPLGLLGPADPAAVYDADGAVRCAPASETARARWDSRLRSEAELGIEIHAILAELREPSPVAAERIAEIDAERARERAADPTWTTAATLAWEAGGFTLPVDTPRPVQYLLGDLSEQLTEIREGCLHYGPVAAKFDGGRLPYVCYTCGSTFGRATPSTVHTIGSSSTGYETPGASAG